MTYSISVKIRVAPIAYGDYLINLANFLGFHVSNPNQKEGNVFQFIPEKKIAGFDLFYEDREPDYIIPDDTSELLEEVLHVELD